METTTREDLEQPEVLEKKAEEAVAPVEQSMSKGQILLIEMLGSLAAAALGVGAFMLSGLYAAAEAGVVTYVLGAFTVSWFVLNFRVGLFMK